MGIKRKKKEIGIPLTLKSSGLDEYSCPDGEMTEGSNKFPDDGSGENPGGDTEVDEQFTFDPSDIPHDTGCGSSDGESCVVFTPDDSDSRDIYIRKDGDRLLWRRTDEEQWHAITLCETLPDKITGGAGTGNYLTLSTSEGLRWLVWRDGAFTDLGSSLPDMDVEIGFRQEKIRDYCPTGLNWPTATMVIPIDPSDTERLSTLLQGGPGAARGSLGEKTRENINFAVNRLLADFREAVAERRLHLGPCRAVTALRMYDGTHTCWSKPFTITPNSRSGGVVIQSAAIEGDTLRCAVELRTIGYSLTLSPGDASRLALWRGIVTGIDIFLTPEAPLWPEDDVNVDGVTSTGGYKSWQIRLPGSDYISRYLDEHTDFYHFAYIRSETLISAAAKSVSLSLDGSLRSAVATIPDFSWQLPFRPTGAGKISGSMAIWGESDGWHLAMSVRDNPFVWPSESRVTPGAGCILGVAPAVRPLSSGQLGEFPAYLFTTHGIWALRTGGDGNIEAVQAISLHRPLAPLRFVSTPDGIVFAATRGLVSLTGSTSRVLTDTYAEDMARAGVTDMESSTTPGDVSCLEKCVIIYQHTSGRIYLLSSDDAETASYCYDTARGCWLRPYARIAEAPEEKESGVWTTRTLKLGSASKRQRVTDLEVLVSGHWTPEERVTLYGADIPGVWHLLADARGRRICGLAGRRMRFHKVVMRGFKSRPMGLVVSVLQ